MFKYFNFNLMHFKIYYIYIYKGTHPEFRSKIEKLDKVRQDSIQFHEYIKESRIHCTNVLYENEIKAALDEYKVIYIAENIYIYRYSFFKIKFIF